MISAAARTPVPPAPGSAPSAFELDLAPPGLLHLLGGLVSPAFVVRCGGLSLFRKGPPGKVETHTLTNPPSDPTGADTLSIDPATIRRICLLHDASGGASLELDFDSCGFALSVWCGDDRRDRETLRRLPASAPSRPLAVESLNRAGAAAWLDDFPSSCPPRCRSRFLFDQETREVSLSLRSPGLFAATTFIPTFIDRDGATLRLSNAGGDRVIHVRADAADGPFLSTTLDPFHLRA